MFYVGQKVKIINDTCLHGLEIGSTVTIDSLKYYPEGNTWDLYHDGWVFDEEDCEPVI